MEPGNVSQTERQPVPPALPVKQRRSLYSEGCVDLDSGGGPISPVCLLQENHTYTDVFTEPTYCHANECPIHQRYESSCCHKERYFSDSTPPPVLRKDLACSTMSLPWGDMPPLSPRLTRPLKSPPKHHTNHQCFDNPLYMLAPLEETLSKEQREGVRPAPQSPAPWPSFSELSFDTPDDQLHFLFSSFSDQANVSQEIQQRYLLFLQSAAQTVEANLSLQVEAGGISYTPEDFLFCEEYKPKQIGDEIYYKLYCNKFPKKVLGGRVQISETSVYTDHTTFQPPHINLQEVIVHFQPSSDQKNKHNTPKFTETHASQSDCTSSMWPHCGSDESVKSLFDITKINSLTVMAFLERGYPVIVERDLPQATLEDFIQSHFLIDSSGDELYEKQLCVLLLQLVTVLQELCSNQLLNIDLRTQNIYLVWPCRARRDGIFFEVNSNEQDNGGKSMTVKEELQKHWGKWGAPRVVLANQSRGTHTIYPAYSSVNGQIGALIRYCLNPEESIASFMQGTIPKSTNTIYGKRLLDLASWLQDETSGLQMVDTKTIIQALLWGPHARVFTFNICSHITTVDNWLAIKRALLVMKMAERGLAQYSPFLEWEECLCLQYFAYCDIERLKSATKQLGLI